jgi:hypothetical protein
LTLVGIALVLLTGGAWWKLALFALFVTGVVFALVFRDLSGTATGGDQSSSELARSSLKTFALTAVVSIAVVIAVVLFLRQ